MKWNCYRSTALYCECSCDFSSFLHTRQSFYCRQKGFDEGGKGILNQGFGCSLLPQMATWLDAASPLGLHCKGFPSKPFLFLPQPLLPNPFPRAYFFKAHCHETHSTILFCLPTLDYRLSEGRNLWLRQCVKQYQACSYQIKQKLVIL